MLRARTARFTGPVLAILAAVGASPLAAGPGEPRLPPGIDPGGVAVALAGPGVDYTRPHLAARLARDGEGEPIGFDFLDGDLRPYEAASGDAANVDAPTGTELAELIIAEAPMARLVVYRAQYGDPRLFPAMARHASLTPARILAIPHAPATPALQASLHASARAHGTLLIITPVTAPRAGGREDHRQSAPTPLNMIAVRHDGMRAPGLAVARAAALAARLLHASPNLALPELKAAILRRLVRLPRDGFAPSALEHAHGTANLAGESDPASYTSLNETTRGPDANVRTDS